MATQGIVPQAPVPVQNVPAPLQVQRMAAPPSQPAQSVQSQPWYQPTAQNFQAAYNTFSPIAAQIAYAGNTGAGIGGIPTVIVPSTTGDGGGDNTGGGGWQGPLGPNSMPYNQGQDMGPQTASPGPYSDTQPIPATFGPSGNMQEIGRLPPPSDRVDYTSPNYGTPNTGTIEGPAGATGTDIPYSGSVPETLVGPYSPSYVAPGSTSGPFNYPAGGPNIPANEAAPAGGVNSGAWYPGSSDIARSLGPATGLSADLTMPWGVGYGGNAGVLPTITDPSGQYQYGPSAGNPNVSVAGQTYNPGTGGYDLGGTGGND